MYYITYLLFIDKYIFSDIFMLVYFDDLFASGNVYNYVVAHKKVQSIAFLDHNNCSSFTESW